MSENLVSHIRRYLRFGISLVFELQKVSFCIVSDGREDVEQSFYSLPEDSDVRVWDYVTLFLV